MEAPKSDETNETNEKSLYVTIPYFLYEAMARSYYTRGSSDFGLPPVRPVASEEPRTEFTGGFDISQDDIPTEWKPLGVARRVERASPDNQPS
jgi:hypothetical protein